VDIPLTTSSSPSTQISSSSGHIGSFDTHTAGPNDTSHDRKYSADSSLKMKLDKKTQPSYSFSADGWSLFLWARDADNIVIYNVRSRIPQLFYATDVHLAAGGANLYATVSKKGNVILFSVYMTVQKLMLMQHENLHIHQVSNGVLVASVRLESPVASIALSRNDEFVALGTAGKALVYNTSNTQLQWCHVLPPSGDLKSKCQRVWFSADSEKVIAATRNTNGDVYTYISDCKSPTTNYNIPHINIPPVNHSVLVHLLYSRCRVRYIDLSKI
jgi:hypothetical protein